MILVRNEAPSFSSKESRSPAVVTRQSAARGASATSIETERFTYGFRSTSILAVPPFVRHADDCGLLHRRMTQQAALDLDRRDVLAAADDHVLQPIADFDMAIGVHDGGVAGVIPADPCGIARREHRCAAGTDRRSLSSRAVGESQPPACRRHRQRGLGVPSRPPSRRSQRQRLPCATLPLRSAS